MDVHGQRVQLLEAVHAFQKQQDEAATLDGLHGAGEKVWRDGLEVLQDAHAIGIAHDLICFLVVYIADVLGGDEEFKGIFSVRISDASFHFLLDLLLPLLAMTGEAKQLVLVGPQDVLAEFDVDIEEDVVEVDDDIFLSVTDDNEETAFAFL